MNYRLHSIALLAAVTFAGCGSGSRESAPATKQIEKSVVVRAESSKDVLGVKGGSCAAEILGEVKNGVYAAVVYCAVYRWVDERVTHTSAYSGPATAVIENTNGKPVVRTLETVPDSPSDGQLKKQFGNRADDVARADAGYLQQFAERRFRLRPRATQHVTSEHVDAYP